LANLFDDDGKGVCCAENDFDGIGNFRTQI